MRLQFFFIISIIHFLSLIFILYDFKFIILLVVESVFFLYYSKINVYIFARIFLVATIIFLVNLFFSEGKILKEIWGIEITYNGFFGGIKRAGLAASTFLFAYNAFARNKYYVLSKINKTNINNLFAASINYFFVLLDVINSRMNLRRILARILQVYRNNKTMNAVKVDVLNINKGYFFYNSVFFGILAGIFIYSCIIA